MTITRYTSKGLTLAQRREINALPWGPARMIRIRAIHTETPKWYNTNGIACCRLNRTSCDDCPNCD
jgi:hypothetical protein